MEREEEIIRILSESKIQLYLEGGKLKARSEKGAMTPELSGLIRDNKERLIAWLGKAKHTDFSEKSIPKIPSDSVSQIEATSTQRRFWFLDRLEHGSKYSKNNIYSAFEVASTFNQAQAETAFRKVIARNKILRSNLLERKGDLFLKESSSVQFSIESIELGDTCEVELKSTIAEYGSRRFDLENDSLIRCSMIGCTLDSVDKRYLVFSIHHAISDGESIPMIMREFLFFYDDKLLPAEYRLPESDIQFEDYAYWNSKSNTSDGFKDKLAFWAKYLEDAPKSHSIPFDSEESDAAAALESLSVSGSLYDQIKSFSSANDVSLFLIVQAAFAILIGRISYEHDVVFGMPVSRRDNSQLQDVIGLLIDTEISRFQFRDNPTFRSLLRTSENLRLDAAKYSDVPFEMIVQEVIGERTNTSPIFQILVNMDYSSEVELHSDVELIKPIETVGLQNKYDITLYIQDSGDSLNLNWLYDAGKFSSYSFGKYKREFEYLLRNLIENPDRGVLNHGFSNVSMATSETADELENYNHIALINQKAISQPSSIALNHNEKDYTYGELVGLVKSFSALFMKRGVTVGDRVLVATGRHVERVVSLLAVNYLGASFIPVSESFPETRILQIIEDAKPKLIVSDELNLSRIPSNYLNDDVVIIESDEVQLALKSKPTDFECAIVKDANRECHIIYTSGSTGVPKGVIGTFGSTINRIHWMLDELPFIENESFIHITSMAFIRAIWELFVPLSGGAKLVLCPREVVKSTEELVEFLQSKAITRMVSAPSLLKAILEVKPRLTDLLPAMRHWFVSGEPLLAVTCQKAVERFPRITFYNLYGSTEVMSDVSIYKVNGAEKSTYVPIGEAISHTKIFVVDALDNLLPDGFIGELCVSGAPVGGGYTTKPVGQKNGFTRIDELEVFKTGDLGRINSLGYIECLGRIDEQVKIRGYRIEPAEVEAVLLLDSHVTHAKVIVHGNDDGKTLVAYIVLNQSERIDATLHREELDSLMSKHLPEYMIVDNIIYLDSLPLKENGKVDKGQLPDPLIMESSESGKPLQTGLEKTLASIWGELLGIDSNQINTTSNFFRLGGHSLMVIKLLNNIRENYSVNITAKDIFDFPRFAELAKLIEGSEACKNLSKSLRPVERSLNSFPLSSAQKRIWFLQQFAQTSSQNNLVYAIQLEHDLNVDACKQAFSALFERHEVLRTTYHEEDVHVVQKVTALENIKFDLANAELTSSEQIDDFIRVEGDVSFDLTQDLMLRATQVHSPNSHGYLIIVVHHIACDGWSIGTLVEDFYRYYRMALASQTIEVRPLELQYIDYASWQNERLNDSELSKQKEYWQTQLLDAPLVHELPLDFSRPKVKSVEGERLSKVMQGDALNRALSFVQENEITPFMFFHSALAIVISQFSMQDTVLIGTPITTRPTSQLDDTVGVFINNIALKTSTDFDSLRDYFRHIKTTNIFAQENSDLPFEELVEHLSVNRDLQTTPVFQILLNLHQEHVNLDTETKGFSVYSSSKAIAKYDIEVSVKYQKDRIVVDWIYDRSIFKPKTIDRLADRLFDVINNLSEIDNDRFRTLFAAPKSNVEALQQSCEELLKFEAASIDIIEAVKRWSITKPHAVAVRDLHQTLSYKELWQRILIVNRMLLENDICQGEVVGIQMGRTADQIITMLACLHAGICFVSLNDSLPEKRLLAIIAEANIDKVLHNDSEDCRAIKDKVKYLINIDSKVSSNSSSENSKMSSFDSQLAYIMFTSGSTGKPKGVCISRSALNNFFAAIEQKLGKVFNSDNRLLAITTPLFDISILEMIGTLVFGGEVILATEQQSIDPQELINIINKYDVNCIQGTPSTWHLFKESNWTGNADVTILTGGEALSKSLATYLLPRCKSLYNCYGPTEATIWSMIEQVVLEQSFDSYSIISGTLDNSVHFVVNSDLELLPDGAVGELCIAGSSLADGYLNNPTLTDDKFIKSRRLINAWYYLTGDLVCKLDSDSYRFLGRKDNQVKLNGYRIELAEVEAIIALDPNVSQCVLKVFYHELTARLVAFVTSFQYEEELEARLRKLCGEYLPSYMQPNTYAFLSEIPLTSSGKINYSLLLEPDEYDGERFVEAATETERLLVGILQKLLHIDQPISIHSNFFDIGGHSLLAVRLVAEIRHCFNKEVSVKTIFEKSDIESLSEFLDSYHAHKVRKPIERLSRDKESFLLSHAQQRLWFIDNLQNGSPEYNMPSALKVSGEFDVLVAEQAIKSVIDQHESLRTIFVEGERGPAQIIVDNVDFSLNVIDYSGLSDVIQKSNLLQEINRSAEYTFNLSSDLLIRASFVRLSPHEGVLLFNMHHIVSDGWSIGLLERSFIRAYKALLNSGIAPLNSFSVQYVDYSHWQREFLDKNELSRQLEYWEELLDGAPISHSIPLDSKRSEAPRKGRAIKRTVSLKLMEQIRRLIKNEKVTLFMLLQTALALHLGRLSNEEDVVVGAPVAGRNVKELDDLIGLFLNTQVYRTEFSDDPEFVDLLARSKHQHLESAKYNDVPFESVVERINPKRETLLPPIFQVLINLNNTEQTLETIDGIVFTTLDEREPDNKYDLTLYIQEDFRVEEDKVDFTWVYDTRIFNHSTIDMIASEFEYLLSQICANPRANVSLYGWANSLCKIASTDETNHIDDEYNFVRLFERQAEKRADKTALEFNDNKYTYQQLNDLANKLAFKMRDEFGISKGSRVVIATSRSEWRVISTLAIIKLGACFIPLSTELPQERLAFMVNSVKPDLIISEQMAIEVYQWLSNYRQLLVSNSLIGEFLSQGTMPNVSVSMVDNTACHIIFTSGSTGLPKGVMGSYGSTKNRISWMLDNYPFLEDEVTVHITSMGFIRSVWELLVPLSGGVKLILCDRNIAKQPDSLCQFLQRKNVTRIVTAPSLLNAVNEALEHLNSSSTDDFVLSKLKYWFVSGEPLPEAYAKQFFKNAFDAKLVNLYGSTEVMSDVFHYEVTKGKYSRIPIGHPIDNVSYEVIDKNNQSVPKGVVGELVLYGDSVALGYIDAKEENLAIAAFNGRYPTGDLARVLPNGLVECLGRKDEQVKVRGHRIELGEIANLLLKDKHISKAIVLVDDLLSESKNLIAYLTKSSSSEYSPEELVTYAFSILKDKLPAYMIPAAIEVIDAFPYRPNGKVDRSKLPKLQYINSRVSAETESEQALVDIWSELLNLSDSEICVVSSFFDQGGHSLLAIRLITAIHKRFEQKIEVKQVFLTPTIREIARILDTNIALLKINAGFDAMDEDAEEFVL